jgi:hypothetical protein
MATILPALPRSCEGQLTDPQRATHAAAQAPARQKPSRQVMGQRLQGRAQLSDPQQDTARHIAR